MRIMYDRELKCILAKIMAQKVVASFPVKRSKEVEDGN